MDTVTQFVLGAAIGEAGFSHRLGRKAALFGGFCGVVPDLDFVMAWGDPWQSLVLHRGASHSLLVLPFVAVVLGWLVWWISKKVDSPWVWVHLAFWGLVTHPLLDTFTAYGTQLLNPASDQRFAIDGVAILDFFYTIPLVVIAWRALRARAELAKRRRQAWIVLAATTAYLFLGVAQSQLALHRTRAAIAELEPDFEPVAMRANPTFFNTLLFRTVARNADGDILVGQASTLGGGPQRVLRFDWPTGDPWVEAAMATEQGQIFEWFADGFVRAEVTPGTDGGRVVILRDARYGWVSRPELPVFSAEIELDAERRLVEARRRGRDDMDIGGELRALWRGILGDHL